MDQQTSARGAESFNGFIAQHGRMLLGLGAAAGVAAVGLYAVDGYSLLMLALWLTGLLALLAFFELTSQRASKLAVRDIAIPAGLGLLFAPLYLVHSYSSPVQVNGDEVVIMSVSDRWADREGVDPFGLSDYFTIPVLPFLLMGRVAQFLGGVNLENMRLVHGVIGLSAVMVSYALFRQLLPRPWAVFAACVLGFNHALVMTSRMALQHSTAVLVEVAALTLLLHGLRRNERGAAFLGGIIAGLGFYVYYPGRAVVVVWLLFLAAVAVFRRSVIPLRRLGAHTAIVLGGFALMAGPVLIAERRAPPGSVDWQHQAWLLFPEGRKVATEWAGGSTAWDGISQNILYGLSAFNNTVPDHGWLYPNFGHGFLDPLSGVLLWVGVLLTLWRLRRSDAPWPLLPLTGFAAVWLTLSFLINKAPNYTRLTIALPFVAYFVTESVRFVVSLASRISGMPPYRRRHVAALLAAVTLVGITAWNVAIAADFAEEGRTNGHDIGSAGRYVQSRSDEPGIRFFLASSERFPYYVFGLPWTLKERLQLFAREGQVGEVVDPARLRTFSPRQPFALLLSREAWDRFGEGFAKRYPGGRVRDVQPDGTRVVFEAPPAASS